VLYNALSGGKKTPKTAPSPRDFVTVLEEKATCTEKLVKVMCVVLEISQRTDRHTQTCSSQYFATVPAGKVIKNFASQNRHRLFFLALTVALISGVNVTWLVSCMSVIIHLQSPLLPATVTIHVCAWQCTIADGTSSAEVK